MTKPNGCNVMIAGSRILIAEDEPLLADELVDAVENLWAFAVGPAMTVDSALQMVRGGYIDAALINAKLRGELTLPIAAALTAHGIPFIFVTGDDHDVREQYPGAQTHPKPSDMPVLMDALGKLLWAGPARSRYSWRKGQSR